MIMRKCDACKKPIPQKQFIEVSVRVMCSNQNEQQDPIEQFDGDYCDRCIASGSAIDDLVDAFTKYKGLESNKKEKQ